MNYVISVLEFQTEGLCEGRPRIQNGWRYVDSINVCSCEFVSLVKWLLSAEKVSQKRKIVQQRSSRFMFVILLIGEAKQCTCNKLEGNTKQTFLLSTWDSRKLHVPLYIMWIMRIREEGRSSRGDQTWTKLTEDLWRMKKSGWHQRKSHFYWFLTKYFGFVYHMKETPG